MIWQYEENRDCFRKEVLRIAPEHAKIGFIGAGKVGVSLGKYFTEKGRKIGGYYSKSPASARWAAEFTKSTFYESLQQIISNCDMILFTVPDDAIEFVWQEAKPYIFKKIIAHCSGLHSSDIFSDIGETESFAYSIHPLMAVSSRENAWKELSDALFTIEGDETYLFQITEIFQKMGNRTKIILPEYKIKYHAAAVISSNYMTALFFMAQKLLHECGFTEEESRRELYALTKGNLDHILKDGCIGALTGPIERNDFLTVKKHMHALSSEMQKVYTANASFLIQIAEAKNKDSDYAAMKELCSSSYPLTIQTEAERKR